MNFIKAESITESSTWQEMTPGGEIYEGGTSRLTKTGDWRSNRPVMLFILSIYFTLSSQQFKFFG